MNIESLKGKIVKVFTANQQEFDLVTEIALGHGYSCIDKTMFDRITPGEHAGIVFGKKDTIVTSSFANNNNYDYAVPAEMFLAWCYTPVMP